jgi:pimeloyl-ACP methyl ester carboxylesterase
MSGLYRSEAVGEAVRARYAAFLERWPIPAEHLSIPTAQGETFVVACGPKEAPSVVLLHGSMANSASWMGDVGVLAQRFRVFAVDMIGEPGFSAASRPPLASGAYAPWFGEVLAGLGVEKPALVGISLGGWLALEYATRHPERVSAVALLCPGGVGRHKNVLPWVLPLMLLGPWGRRRIMARMGGGPPPRDVPEPIRAFGEFMGQIQAGFRPRTERLPRFDDAALGRLSMPVLAILGGRDVMIDSAGTRERLEALVPRSEIVWLPQAGHILIGHAETIERFLVAATE